MPWHLRLAIGLLVAWGLGTSVAFVLSIASPGDGFGNFLKYLPFMVTPVFTFAAAFFLWKRSQYAIAALASHLIALLGFAVFTQRFRLQTTGSYFDAIVGGLPSSFLAFFACLSVCLVYALFLEKWGEIR